jgi:hypothetical protein
VSGSKKPAITRPILYEYVEENVKENAINVGAVTGT